MAQMIRKQVYIEPRQNAILKRLARTLGVTEAEVIRRAIDRESDLALAPAARSDPDAWEEVEAYIRALMASPRPIPAGARELTAWEREKAFIADRMADGPVRSTRRWNREELYEERLNRYGQNPG